METKRLYAKEQLSLKKQKAFNRNAGAEMDRREKKVRVEYTNASLVVEPNSVMNLSLLKMYGKKPLGTSHRLIL